MSKYGLIGKDINYSISPIMHKIIANYFNQTINYQLYDMNKDKLKKIIQEKELTGFNVTKPYKKLMYDMIDNKSKLASKIKAINTVFLKNDSYMADNTDYYGLMDLFDYYELSLFNKAILILGTGGAALAAYYAALNYTKNIIFVSRNKNDKSLTGKVINYEEITYYQYDIIINATPIGTYPNNNTTPLIKELVNDKIVIDLVYNPKVTKLMSYSNHSYNGLVMLISQAIHAQNLWFNKNYPVNKKVINDIKEALLNEQLWK